MPDKRRLVHEKDDKHPSWAPRKQVVSVAIASERRRGKEARQSLQNGNIQLVNRVLFIKKKKRTHFLNLYDIFISTQTLVRTIFMKNKTQNCPKKAIAFARQLSGD